MTASIGLKSMTHNYLTHLAPASGSYIVSEITGTLGYERKLESCCRFSVDVGLPVRYGTHPELMYAIQMLRRPKNTCSRQQD